MRNGNSIIPISAEGGANGKLYIQEFDDRHGTRRLYYRRAGFKAAPIEWTGGTVESFLDAYAKAKAAAAPKAPKAEDKPKADKGTVAWLVWGFLDSYEFHKRPDSVQAPFRRALKRLAESKAGPTSARAFATVEQVGKLLLKMRNTPAKGNEWRDAMNHMFKWAVGKGHVPSNPVPATDTLETGKGGFHTWTLAEIEQYRRAHPVGTMARAALEIIYWEGFRASDVIRLCRRFSSDGLTWDFVQKKNSGTKYEVQRVGTIQPETIAILQETHCPDGGMAWDNLGGPFLRNEHGKPFTRGTFTKAMRRWCNEAKLPKCTAHGIRKRGGNDLAQNGATPKEVMAFLGQSSEESAKPYTAQAERRLLSDAAAAKRRASVVAEVARAAGATAEIVKPEA